MEHLHRRARGRTSATGADAGQAARTALRRFVTALAVSALVAACGPAPVTPAPTPVSPSAPAATPATPEAASTPAVAGWAAVEDVENPAGFLVVHHDANGNPVVRCAPCHPAVDTLMTDAVAGPAGAVAVGWVIQEFRGATWWSADGARWTLDDDFPEVSMLRAVAANDRHYVAVGRRGPGATAWTSTDGRHWTASSSPAFAATPIRVESIARLGDGFVAAGSEGSDFGSGRAAFWASPDGLQWTRAPDSHAFDDSRAVSVAAGAGRLVAVGLAGAAGAHGPGAAWTSADGLSWSRADGGAFASATVRSVAFVPGTGFVAVGEDKAGNTAIVWRSADGTAWEREPWAPELGRPGIQVRAYDVVAGGPGIVVVGTLSEGIQYGVVAIWSSPDGRRWSLEPPTAQLQDGELSAVTPLGSRLLAVGDRGAPDAYQAEAWLSPDRWGR